MTEIVSFKPQKFVRHPLVVEAVQVTEDNITDVANWCGGIVRTFDPSGVGNQARFKKYIKVKVKRALRERQTRAYYGDWVLRAGTGFRIYTPKAFKTLFNEQVDDMLDVLERMVSRSEEEDKLEEDQVNEFTEDTLPQGGRNTSFISPS